MLSSEPIQIHSNTSPSSKLVSIVPESSWLRGIVLYMPRCSRILKLSLLYCQPIYFLSVTATYSLFISFLLTYLAVLFIPCLPICRLFCCLFLFIACPPVQLFFSLPVRLLSCLFIPCLPSGQCPPVQLFIHSLPIPSGQCPPVQLFVHFLPIPSGQCPPVQLFIHSLPARVFSRLFIPSCPPVQLFIYSFPPTYSAIY
jgi:hypothetical protein